MKISFSSNHSYSEQIIVKIIDEDRNRFVVFEYCDRMIFLFLTLVLNMKSM